MANHLAGVLFKLQDLMRHSQGGDNQDRQLGNMWNLGSMLVLNLIHFMNQKIRHLPGSRSFDVGFERVGLPKEFYGNKMFQ